MNIVNYPGYVVTKDGLLYLVTKATVVFPEVVQMSIEEREWFNDKVNCILYKDEHDIAIIPLSRNQKHHVAALENREYEEAINSKRKVILWNENGYISVNSESYMSMVKLFDLPLLQSINLVINDTRIEIQTTHLYRLITKRIL